MYYDRIIADNYKKVDDYEKYGFRLDASK